MFLALDVGNTHTVIGGFSTVGGEKSLHQKSPQKTWRISTHPFGMGVGMGVGTGDELILKLQGLLAQVDVRWSQVTGIGVSSVVPEFTRMLRGAIPEDLLHVIDWHGPFSFDLNMLAPEQVGVDRLVNAEAAVRAYGAPCIIIDSGTATTLCALAPSPRGSGGRPEYLGGAIMPSIDLMLEALVGKTAQLFHVELKPPSQAIGRNTQEALQSGIVLGCASMLEGMIGRLREELVLKCGVESIPVVATGGKAELMKALLTSTTRGVSDFDPDLTLKGICFLYDQRNKPQT